MAKKVVGPSKTDLMAVLKECYQRTTPEVQRLRVAADAADKAVDDFEENCKELQRLKRAYARAYSAKYHAERKVRAERSKEINRLRDLVRIKGPTLAVARKVAALAKKYQEQE